MSESAIVELQTPPLPYYWESGRSDFRVGERHPNRRNLGLYDLLIVIGGALHIGENGQEWTLGAGDTLLLLPDGEHYAVKPCERETSFYWVHFEHCEWNRGSRDTAADDAASSLPFGNPYAMRLVKQAALPVPQEAFGLMRRLLALPVGDSFWEEQRLLSRLLSLLEERNIGGTQSPSTKLAEQAAAYLQQHYQEELTNESVAAALHFHPNYVVRCMKTNYGVTPMHYLLQFRLDRAKRLLVSTEWPIERIAEEVGFRYAPYFSTCFKRSVGVTPLQFRRQVLS